MYHIKNDKRCINSAETIVTALEEMLGRKPFLDITVTDIQKTAGIGRSTFYRHFDTIDDVVEYSADESFREIAADYYNLSHHDFILRFIKGIIEKGGEMMNLLASGRAEIVTRSFRKNLLKMMPDSSDADIAQYDFAVFAATCISIIKTWDENGRRESVEELAGIVERYIKFPD